MKNKWEYGGTYKKYDMSGIIEVQGGTLKVHNIFEPLPEFMKKADCIFCDPPCCKGNINTFYTKADRTDYQASFEPFTVRFFECIDEIKPKKLFLEVFKSNYDRFLKEVQARYKFIQIYQAKYYHNAKNTCWIISASNEPLEEYPFEGMDEEDVIYWIGKNVDYEVIGDLCMGTGLVGKSAIKAGKSFVGTELNAKRLALLVDYVKNNSCCESKNL